VEAIRPSGLPLDLRLEEGARTSFLRPSHLLMSQPQSADAWAWECAPITTLAMQSVAERHQRTVRALPSPEKLRILNLHTARLVVRSGGSSRAPCSLQLPLPRERARLSVTLQGRRRRHPRPDRLVRMRQRAPRLTSAFPSAVLTPTTQASDSLDSCGGCSTMPGSGQDCGAIKHAHAVRLALAAVRICALTSLHRAASLDDASSCPAARATRPTPTARPASALRIHFSSYEAPLTVYH
jgi:hypothetical protein